MVPTKWYIGTDKMVEFYRQNDRLEPTEQFMAMVKLFATKIRFSKYKSQYITRSSTLGKKYKFLNIS